MLLVEKENRRKLVKLVLNRLSYQSLDNLGARDLSCAVSGFGQVSQRTIFFFKKYRSYKISLNQRVSL